jgi:hypothetical protein
LVKVWSLGLGQAASHSGISEACGELASACDL